MELPADQGTYILILRLAEPKTVSVGRLGTFDFLVGWYAYVGSAFHSSGLRGRLNHHLTPIRRPHWHIDYLRQIAVVEQVWYLASDIRYEHQWAAWLAVMPGVEIPVRRFGASDCTCPSHLFYFKNIPPFNDFCMLVCEPTSEQERIRCRITQSINN